jgi:hypothetical protein
MAAHVACRTAVAHAQCFRSGAAVARPAGRRGLCRRVCGCVRWRLPCECVCRCCVLLQGGAWDAGAVRQLAQVCVQCVLAGPCPSRCVCVSPQAGCGCGICSCAAELQLGCLGCQAGCQAVPVAVFGASVKQPAAPAWPGALTSAGEGAQHGRGCCHAAACVGVGPCRERRRGAIELSAQACVRVCCCCPSVPR